MTIKNAGPKLCSISENRTWITSKFNKQTNSEDILSMVLSDESMRII